MIEINLLPQEYRVQERTPLGLFLTVVIGICAVGAAGVYDIRLNKDLTNAQEQNAKLKDEQQKSAARKAEVQKLEKEIEIKKKRQETIIEISQSKIIWSQKLIQFGKIMAEYPDFWIDRLSLSPGGSKGGKLTCSFFALGNDLRKAAAFRERVISDTNFWYHFDKFDAPTVRVNSAPGGPLAKYGYTGAIMSFGVTIPVR